MKKILYLAFVAIAALAMNACDNLGTVAEPYAPTFEVDKK